MSQLPELVIARSSIYTVLSHLVSDIVSVGEGSELYRVALPQECVGMSIDEVASRLRSEHRATLLAVVRGGLTHANPSSDFRVVPDDDLVIVAESLGDLEPLREPSAVA
jgi:voltage-gated potassium channel